MQIGGASTAPGVLAFSTPFQQVLTHDGSLSHTVASVLFQWCSEQDLMALQRTNSFLRGFIMRTYGPSYHHSTTSRFGELCPLLYAISPTQGLFLSQVLRKRKCAKCGGVVDVKEGGMHCTARLMAAMSYQFRPLCWEHAILGNNNQAAAKDWVISRILAAIRGQAEGDISVNKAGGVAGFQFYKVRVANGRIHGADMCYKANPSTGRSVGSFIRSMEHIFTMRYEEGTNKLRIGLKEH